MDSLSGFYFDQHALGYLAQLILTLTMTLYLANLDKKTTATRWFLLFFACMTVYAGVSVVEATSVWLRRYYAVHLQIVLISLALVALLQVAYRYPKEPAQPSAGWEARFVFGVSILATLLAAGWAVYQFSQLTPSGDPTTNTLAAKIWLALSSVWVLLTFWRRAFHFSHRLAPHLPWWRHLAWPEGVPARTAFAFVMAVFVAVALSSLLAVSGWLLNVPQLVRALIPSDGVLLVLFFLGLAYFNYAPENTSFIVKLIGVSLVTLLLVVGSVGVIVTPAFESDFDIAALRAAPRTIRFEPAPNGGYRVSTLPLQLDTDFGQPRAEGSYPLPFSFPFYGQDRQDVTLRRDGNVVFGRWSSQALKYNLRPAITVLDLPRDVPETIFVGEESDTFLITWAQEPAPGSQELTTLQVLLRADGSFDFRYQAIGADDARRAGIQSGDGGHQITPFDPTATYDQTLVSGDGMLTDYDIVWRQFLHERLQPLVFLLLGASVLILLGLPLFFHLILVRPMDDLVHGIQAVDAGDLSVRVPVRYRDEVGLITAAFNRMVASVQRAEQRLEARVAERTQELAASEARFRSLADSTFESVIIHDEGRILDVNRAAAELLGYTRDELIGMHIEDFLTSASKDAVARELETGSEEPYQVEGVARDGSLIPMEVRGKVAPYGNRQVRVAAARDLTERKKVEAQQRRLAALEERERIGRELHDDVSQTLSYLNVQAQMVRYLLEEGRLAEAEAPLAQLAQVVRDAHSSIRDHILGIRAAEPAPVEDFFETLERYLEIVREQFGLHTQVSLPDDLHDGTGLASEVETKLLRIIQEALTNVRWHAGVDTARLTFTRLADEVQIMIADDGPGFDRQQAYQAGHFGLEIMRERAESVDGSLEVRSSPGEGTQVIVRLPTVLQPPAAEDAGPSWRVLLADDHPLFLDGLRKLLVARGIDVVGLAHDGVEAQALARELRPDLIVMDVHMPRCDGLEATQRIKAEQPEIKIVMLTVAAEDEILFEALKRGASGFLLKSLEGGRFFRMLNDLMRGETVLSPSLAAHVLTEFAQRDGDAGPEDDKAPALTARQREVLQRLAQGLSNQDIAVELNITESTVKYHVSQILSRLHMRNRFELADYARQQGLVASSDDESPPQG